ncbi:MAG: diacylglycerol kinase family protein [Dehalococcoidia bacterium]
MPRAVVIANPYARRAVPAAMLEAVLSVLGPNWETEVRVTRDAEGPVVLGRHEAERGASIVFACGGDGTLNGVINGVRGSGRSDVTVGLIPAGTANVWAREAGIPRDPLGAVLLAQRGRTVDLDLGLACIGERIERRFLLMCSFGFDAAVVRRVEGRPGLKRRLAQGAFVVAGAGAVAVERPVPLEGDWDAVRSARSLFLGVAGNSRLYGGVSQLTSAARMDDGLLDLALFEARQGPVGIFDATTHLVRGMLRGKRPWHGHRAARFEYHRGPRFGLTPGVPLGVQVDGEYLATVEAGERLSLSAEPRAVRVLVGDAPSPLYGGGAG